MNPKSKSVNFLKSLCTKDFIRWYPLSETFRGKKCSFFEAGSWNDFQRLRVLPFDPPWKFASILMFEKKFNFFKKYFFGRSKNIFLEIFENLKILKIQKSESENSENSEIWKFWNLKIWNFLNSGIPRNLKF